jgi:WD40 repeat protein
MNPLGENPPLRLDRDNPWPGLAPFDEADSAFFHGRQVEAAELLSLIQLEGLTVLFGRSGLGKTSLLTAGVFPALRADNCLPVYLRLAHADNAPSLRMQVLGELHDTCVAHEVDDAAPADPDPVDAGPADDPEVFDGSLWSLFHQRDAEFWSRDNRLVTPVIVLDQFEEIFTIGQETDAARARSAAFLNELADLVESRPPPAVKAALAQNASAASRYNFGPATVKLVLSFREDFLAEMEDLKRAMPALMVNRLRLLPMDGAQAYAVVTESGGALVDDEVARCILRLSWKNEPEPAVLAADFERMEIDPALLSVVCSELNQKRQQAKQPHITRSLLAGADREILSGFYARSMEGLDQRVRAFVEDELITDKGYRDSHDWSDALDLPGVSREAVAALVARRLLRVDERQGQRRLELTHDVLTRVVKDSRDQRRAREAEAQAAAREQKAREEQRKNRRNAVFVVLGALLVGLLLVFAAIKTNLADQLLLAAQGMRLMAVADRAQDTHYDISLLLNLEALRVKQTPDAQAGLLRRFNSHPHLAKFLGHKYSVGSVTFSSDGKLLAAGDGDNVRLWDMASGKVLATLAGHRAHINSVAFSPDGKLLASGDRAKIVLLWDVASGKARATLAGHKDSINSVAFSPDGKQLASGSRDKTALLWDVASGKALATLAGNKDSINSVAFSPDGKQLASGSSDKTVLLWDVASGKALATLAGHKAGVSSVVFSPDGRQLASGSYDDTVLLWDVASGKVLATLAGHKAPVLSVAFSPDGKRLASGSYDDTVLLWGVASGKALATLAGHKTAVSNVTFSPDGKRLASGSDDNTVLLWDVEGGKAQVTLAGHKAGTLSVTFSPDGQRLASGSDDKTVLLWEVASGKALATLAGHKSSVRSVAFNPDGKRLTSGSFDMSVLLWDVASGKALTTLAGYEGFISGVAFSPDGKRRAFSNLSNTVLLWDVASGKAPVPLVGHKSLVWSVAFSQDGKRLASSSWPGTVILWDIEGPTPANLATLDVHTGVTYSSAFSPDGKQLAFTSGTTIRLWNLDPAYLTPEACRTANRNLTCAEWKQYIGPDIPYRKTCEALPAPEVCK